MARVLVEMREGTVPLSDVEAKDAEADSADKLLLEWTLLLVRELIGTLSCQQVVLVIVELFFDFATEHSLLVNQIKFIYYIICSALLCGVLGFWGFGVLG